MGQTKALEKNQSAIILITPWKDFIIIFELTLIGNSAYCAIIIFFISEQFYLKPGNYWEIKLGLMLPKCAAPLTRELINLSIQ